MNKLLTIGFLICLGFWAFGLWGILSLINQIWERVLI